MTERTAFPTTFAAGESVEYRRTNADFPANQGWSLKVGVRGANGANATVTADGADYLVSFSPTTTGPLQAGKRKWVELYEHATLGTKQISGDVFITPNIYAAQDGELQSDNEKTLAALKAARDGSLKKNQESIAIDGIQVVHIPYKELEHYIAVYEAKVAAERRGGGVQVNLLGWSRFR